MAVMVRKLGFGLGVGYLLLLVNPAYLNAFPDPNLFYVANVLLHIVLGAALFVLQANPMPAGPAHLLAITAISTFDPRTRPATCTVARAGRFVLK